MTDGDGGRRLLRVLGPPGTGKTTELARRVRHDVQYLGPDSTLIASFTVTAAQEIGSRGLGLAKGYCGTLHSHAFRVCGQPTMALDAKVLDDWNSSCPPDWRVSAASKGVALAAADKAVPGSRATTPEQAVTGDELLAAHDLLRARAVPPSEWPSNVRAFSRRWTAWKSDVEAFDFTDLIVQAYRRARDGEGPPGNPKRLILDEAQDNTKIELALAMLWAERVDTTVFAFDDDQAINAWRGGDPSPLVDLVDGPALGDTTVSSEVLSQSYRVPPAVHAVAQRWIERSSHRFPKVYLPRRPDEQRGDRTEADAHGYAYRLSVDLEEPALADLLEADLEAGESPMVLASCGYMLKPLIRTLRARGLPFHNPFRPADGSWNPLGGESGMSSAERVYRFLVAHPSMGERRRLWTGEDIKAWADLISGPKAGMVRGLARTVEALPKGTVPWPVLAAMFKPGPLDAEGQPTHSADLVAAATVDLEWFARNLVPSKAPRAEYPIQVARVRGAEALVEGPRVVVGTVHSVKGATSNIVYLAPDLAPAGMRQWQGHDPAARDSIRRVFYVGMTRAFRRLAVLSPSSTTYVDPSVLLPSDLETAP